MARTRTQRRRRTLLISLALAVTLAFLLFGRDVSRAAHGANGPRRSEDRSFGALANTLLKSENAFDQRLDRLLSEGGSLHRYVFAARLSQLDQQLPQWSVTAEQLRRPNLAHHVNEELYQSTLARVAAYETLLGDVAHTLSLPWSDTGTAVASPAASLQSTSAAWNGERFALAKEPGGVHLNKVSASSAAYYAQNGATALAQSSTLRLVRAVGIVAIRVSPSPLPASEGTLLLPPTDQVRFGISVLNAGFDEQPVRLTIRVTPLNGRGTAFLQSMTTTLGPLAAYAFVPNTLKTVPSERARVVVTLTGAPAAEGKVVKEDYHLQMSPSGNTAGD